MFHQVLPPRCYIRVNCQGIGAIGQRKVTEPHWNPSKPVETRRNPSTEKDPLPSLTLDFRAQKSKKQVEEQHQGKENHRISQVPWLLEIFECRSLNQDKSKAPHGKSGKSGTRLCQASATFQWQHISSSCPKWVGLRLHLGACKLRHMTNLAQKLSEITHITHITHIYT